MHEGAPHIPYEVDDFNDSNQKNESSSPMEQKLDFNVDIVFDDLSAIIPEYNKFIRDRGEEVPEKMLTCQNRALDAMRSIKNSSDSIPRSKEELIMELEKREKDEEDPLTTEARELIEGIL